MPQRVALRGNGGDNVILEGIVTTVDEDGRAHIAPMGAVVDDSGRTPLERLVLRPFQTSATFANVRRTGQGVFHVTDDVDLLARAAVGRLEPAPELIAAAAVEGFVLADACRWYAFRVRRIDASSPRARIDAEVVAHGRLRDFFGLNRAKHAVVEAAILATRLAIVPADEVRAEMDRLAVLVRKTGGRSERAAFQFLADYVAGAAGEGR